MRLRLGPGGLPEHWAAVDTETTGLSSYHGDRVFAISAVTDDGQELFERDSFRLTREICEDPDIDKVFHNAKFDLKMLEASGIQVRGQVWDTMLLCHMLDGRDAEMGLSLDRMGRKYVPQTKPKVVEEIERWFKENGRRSKSSKDYSLLPTSLLRERAVGDTQITHALFRRIFPVVYRIFPTLLQIEHDLLHVVKKAEDRGFLIDMDEVNRQEAEYDFITEDVEDWFVCMSGDESFNMNSETQIRRLLYSIGLEEELEKMAGPKEAVSLRNSRRTKTGNPKLDDWNLRRIEHPATHMLLVGRAAAKMRDTFLGQIRRYVDCENVLHCNLRQVGTATGRFSCSNPNLQNIPIEGDRRTSYTEQEARMMVEMTGHHYSPAIKRNFVVRSGYAHMHSDKKQAEMVVVADQSRSADMIRIFSSGESIHDGLCRILYGQWTKGLKTRTKAVVFGFAYGAGDFTLAIRIGSNIKEAKETRARLERALPDLPRWAKTLEKEISAKGYVETKHGRRHYLDRDVRYKAVNRICQGTVADEIKDCMVRINDMLEAEGHDARVLLNIHDDVVTEIKEEEVPEVAPKIFEIMNSSRFHWDCPPAADANITYGSWAHLMDVEDLGNHESFSREAYYAKFGQYRSKHQQLGNLLRV